MFKRKPTIAEELQAIQELDRLTKIIGEKWFAKAASSPHTNQTVGYGEALLEMMDEIQDRMQELYDAKLRSML